LTWIFFLKNFQEIYNSRLRERYGDDLLIHPDFDMDLWMEVGSSGGPDKNRVYRLFNTTAENLRLPVVSQSLGALSINIEHPVWGVCGLETTIWTILDGLWSSPSNGHGDEIKDEWWYMCNPFFAIRSREQPASSSSAAAAVILV
jgi:hypothetical protein